MVSDRDQRYLNMLVALFKKEFKERTLGREIREEGFEERKL
jgi:hypothetical protein